MMYTQIKGCMRIYIMSNGICGRFTSHFWRNFSATTTSSSRSARKSPSSSSSYFDTSHEILHYTIWWCAVTYWVKKTHTQIKIRKSGDVAPGARTIYIMSEYEYVWSGDPTTRIPARITVECIPTTCCHFNVFVFKSWKSKHGGRFLRHLEAPLAGNEKLLAFWWDKCYNKKIHS